MDKILWTFNSFNLPAKSLETAKEADSVFKLYLSTLQKLPDAERQTIRREPKPLLESLSPEVNSIGYLFVLDLLHHFNAAQPTIDREHLLEKTLHFLLNFNVYQIRAVGPLFWTLLEHVASGSLYPPSVAVELLAKVILRIDPSGSTFTSVHLPLATLAYDSHHIEPAMSVIDSDILFFPTRSRRFGSKEREELVEGDALSAMIPHDSVKASSVLEYQLVQSLIYISRRDWAKAQRALGQLISHPTKDKGLSKIMTEGYKKWILVGLLNEGKAPDVPGSVGNHARYAYTATSGDYGDVAALFPTDDAQQLKTVIETRASTWQQDENAALMAEVVRAYQKWQMLKLRRIFHQVSIAQIRAATSSAETAAPLESDEEVLALINEMIASGMLKGEVEVGPTGGESYLRFREELEVQTEDEFAREMAWSSRAVEGLSKQYRATNDRLSGDKEYIKQLNKEQKMLEREEGDAGVGFGVQIEDEDLMTGVLSHA